MPSRCTRLPSEPVHLVQRGLHHRAPRLTANVYGHFARSVCCILAAELDWKSEGAGSEREEPSCFGPLQRARDTGFEPVAFVSGGVSDSSTRSTRVQSVERTGGEHPVVERMDALEAPGRFRVGPPWDPA